MQPLRPLPKLVEYVDLAKTRTCAAAAAVAKAGRDWMWTGVDGSGREWGDGSELDWGWRGMGVLDGSLQDWKGMGGTQRDRKGVEGTGEEWAGLDGTGQEWKGLQNIFILKSFKPHPRANSPCRDDTHKSRSM